MGQAPIAYVFEAGDRHRGRLMQRMEQDAFPPPIFRPKKDVVRDGVLCPGFTPLQAADILAYEHFLATKRWEATRWAFWELDKYPPGVLTTYTAENIQELENLLRLVRDNPNVIGDSL